MIKILFVCHGNSMSVKDVSPFDWVNRGQIVPLEKVLYYGFTTIQQMKKYICTYPILL